VIVEFKSNKWINLNNERCELSGKKEEISEREIDELERI
jgi:hypothetical protein